MAASGQQVTLRANRAPVHFAPETGHSAFRNACLQRAIGLNRSRGRPLRQAARPSR